ncbi:hypothetical protein KCU64_g17949, partial [Aureobasidium melanogenum]
MTFISRIVAKPAFRSSFQPVTRINITSRSYAAMGHSVPPLNDPSLFKQQAFINGKWVDAKSGQT